MAYCVDMVMGVGVTCNVDVVSGRGDLWCRCALRCSVRVTCSVDLALGIGVTYGV